MSDNCIILVPDDPRFVPDSARQTRAKARFAEIAPDAEIEATVSDTVEFFDCGGNFERICCPTCGSELEVEWWQDRMDQECDHGFKLDKHPLPCCNAEKTLNDLVYEWPQAFGTFALKAMNPNVGKLTDKNRKEFEKILGTKLRVVYQHM